MIDELADARNWTGIHGDVIESARGGSSRVVQRATSTAGHGEVRRRYRSCAGGRAEQLTICGLDELFGGGYRWYD